MAYWNFVVMCPSYEQEDQVLHSPNPQTSGAFCYPVIQVVNRKTLHFVSMAKNFLSGILYAIPPYLLKSNNLCNYNRWVAFSNQAPWWSDLTCASWGMTCSVCPLACTTLGITGICTGKGMVWRTVCPPAVEMGIWTGMVACGTPDCITCVAICPTCVAWAGAACPAPALAVPDGRTLPTLPTVMGCGRRPVKADKQKSCVWY